MNSTFREGLSLILEHNPSLLQAAISYSQRGWRVFPLRPGTKIPFLPGSWLEYATNEAWQIAEWWLQVPQANIAIVTGTDITVVDVDQKPGKPSGWVAIGDLLHTDTPWCSTPNNGYHFYYQHIGGSFSQVPGVDIQQGNHYVLAPPSSLPEGAYQWGTPLGPIFDNGIKPFPPELRLFLQKATTAPLPLVDQPILLEHAPEMPLHRMKEAHVSFLEHGEVIAYPSRSEAIQSIASRLYLLGHTDAEVLSMLWANPWVQEVASDHRRHHDDKALSYLWLGCRKVRHLKPQVPEEAFSSVVRAPERALEDEAQRLGEGSEVREYLARVAEANLDPLAKEKVLQTLANQAVFGTLPALKKMLKQYEKAAKSKSKSLIWKDVVGEDERPLPTIENLKILLDYKKVSVRYNLMEHAVEIKNLCEDHGKEERVNSQYAAIRSLAIQYRMSPQYVPEQLTMLASKNEYHPMKELLKKVTWDGRSRIQEVIDTVQVAEDYKGPRNILMRRWFISIMAAVYGFKNRAPRGVLTFVGKQWAGKSTWLKYVVPEGMYYQGHILRTDQRDSVVKGLRHLVVELGELGSTFRRQDIEVLKSHIGAPEDIHRLPYAPKESRWQRRTIFAASANNENLLHDSTGNTRWWVIPVTSIDLDEMERRWDGGLGPELLQFWEEVHQCYESGEPWDLTDEELANLQITNEKFVYASPIVDALLDTYQWQDKPPQAGYKYPKTVQWIIRDLFGGPRSLNGKEAQDLRDALKRYTGMDGPELKRFRLASVDGKTIGAMSTEVGRYWFMPPLREQTAVTAPFKGVKE